ARPLRAVHAARRPLDHLRRVGQPGALVGQRAGRASRVSCEGKLAPFCGPLPSSGAARQRRPRARLPGWPMGAVDTTAMSGHSGGSPRLKAPHGACDCHMHIYEARFPPAPTSQFPPPHAPVTAYRDVQRQLGLMRAVVVQPNAYAFDNACTEEAIRELGRAARGIATIRPDIADAELERLTRAGFRGARCFMLQGGLLSWDDVDAIAARVAPFGWHVQLQLDGRDMPLYAARIARLPTEAVIDHNGKFLEPVPPSHPAFRALLALLDGGRCWVKLSAPYETSKS